MNYQEDHHHRRGKKEKPDPIAGIRPLRRRLPAPRFPKKAITIGADIKKAGPHRWNPASKAAITYSPAFAVPSALQGLTSLFGMGRGGALVLSSPEYGKGI